MKTISFDNKEQWLLARKGKITGTGLKDIVSSGGITKEAISKELETLKVEFKKTAKKEELQVLLPKESLARLDMLADKKLGFYELIAQRLTVSEEDFEGYVPNETPMDRGTRLQKYAIARLKNALGKEIDERTILWLNEENESIGYSPDGVINDTEAVETKCLSSARHIEAWITQKIPEEYEFQKLQAFIVNEKLEKLYFCFYDPRIPAKDFFYFEINRSEVEEQATRYLEYQKAILKQVDEKVAKISNF